MSDVYSVFVTNSTNLSCQFICYTLSEVHLLVDLFEESKFIKNYSTFLNRKYFDIKKQNWKCSKQEKEGEI